MHFTHCFPSHYNEIQYDLHLLFSKHIIFSRQVGARWWKWDDSLEYFPHQEPARQEVITWINGARVKWTTKTQVMSCKSSKILMEKKKPLGITFPTNQWEKDLELNLIRSKHPKCVPQRMPLHHVHVPLGNTGQSSTNKKDSGCLLSRLWNKSSRANSSTILNCCCCWCCCYLLLFFLFSLLSLISQNVCHVGRHLIILLPPW